MFLEKSYFFPSISFVFHLKENPENLFSLNYEKKVFKSFYENSKLII